MDSTFKEFNESTKNVEDQETMENTQHSENNIDTGVDPEPARHDRGEGKLNKASASPSPTSHERGEGEQLSINDIYKQMMSLQEKIQKIQTQPESVSTSPRVAKFRQKVASATKTYGQKTSQGRHKAHQLSPIDSENDMSEGTFEPKYTSSSEV